MKQYQARFYHPDDFSLWNAFIGKAKNATFLLDRNFMDYHADRFTDASVVVTQNEKIVAVLPANRVGNIGYSHQGLTYGGLVLPEGIRLGEVITVFREVLSFLHDEGIKELYLKPIPSIYCRFFSEEINYCLFLLKAEAYRKECLSVLDLRQGFAFSKDRRQCIRRGSKAQLEIREEANFELFWNQILLPNLQDKHHAQPVHSWKEMLALQQKFPQRIRHFNVYDGDELVAGTTVFVTDRVAHPQYISGNARKNELGSLDYLYDYLIREVFNSLDYFDFGPSHQDNGTKINQGVLFWKESFGAKTAIQEYYKVSTANFTLLDQVWL